MGNGFDVRKISAYDGGIAEYIVELITGDGDERWIWFDPGVVRTDEYKVTGWKRVRLIEWWYDGGACSITGGGSRERRIWFGGRRFDWLKSIV